MQERRRKTEAAMAMQAAARGFLARRRARAVLCAALAVQRWFKAATAVAVRRVRTTDASGSGSEEDLGAFLSALQRERRASVATDGGLAAEERARIEQEAALNIQRVVRGGLGRAKANAVALRQDEERCVRGASWGFLESLASWARARWCTVPMRACVCVPGGADQTRPPASLPPAVRKQLTQLHGGGNAAGHREPRLPAAQQPPAP